MCGLCGYVSFVPGERPTLENLKAMNKTIAHRGPDDEGYWVDENVGLAHRRLSIIDLSPLGHQPMSVLSLPLKIIFNGEIYNFQEIRDELQSKGRSFISKSDTEVILHAFDEWGNDCVRRFNGMFVFAIWNTEKKELFIARDRLGVKPLYYFHNQKHFVFASELKAILPYPYFSRSLNQTAVEDYFAFKYIRAPRTIFKDVQKLEPGHSLTVSRGKVCRQRYWDVLDALRGGRPGERSEGGYEEEFESLLDSAVRYRMISDVPIGAFLSGGIDSSTVVSSMVKQSSHVRTFSIGFPDRSYNEAPYAKRVAQALGTEHTEFIVSPQEIFNSIELLATHFDEPFADPSSLPTYLVSKLARRSVTVALTGDAGDEVFWGYNRYRLYGRALQFAFLPYPLRKFVFSALEKIPVDLIHKGAQGLQFTSPEECYNYLSSIFKRNDFKKILPKSPSAAPTLFERDYRAHISHPLMLPNIVDFETYLTDDILTKVDRTSMAVALEARSPLIDYRIVEFGLRLPFELKYRNGVQKYLLKKLLFRRLDRTLFDRPKRGFDLPLNTWFRKELKLLVEERLGRQRLSRYGFLDADFARSIIDKHMSGQFNYYYMVWALLSFDLWYERYYESHD
jgi:asparagine synthase (glutamine-hydrolysing)